MKTPREIFIDAIAKLKAFKAAINEEPVNEE